MERGGGSVEERERETGDTLLGKVENSKIDGGAVGSKGKTRRYCLKINGAECREKTTKKAVGVSRRRSPKNDSEEHPRLRSITATESHPRRDGEGGRGGGCVRVCA